MPVKRTNAKKGASKTPSKRTRLEKDVANAPGDDFFAAADSDDDRSDEDQQQEEEETAEEKRLRIAKQYLSNLRARNAASDDEEENDRGSDEEGRLENHDAVGATLRAAVASEAGYAIRPIAHHLSIPTLEECSALTPCVVKRGHGQSVTAITLTDDDAVVYSVAKDGSMFKWDVETGHKTRISTQHAPMTAMAPEQSGTVAEWAPRNARQVGNRSLLAVACSSDGRLVAAGGGDRRVHIFDTRNNQKVLSFPGHKDIVSSLVFREHCHELYSASFDRTIKLWSVSDKSYMDTLFGHQAPVLCIDARRNERPVTGGFDHTCRVWKVAEESQLVFRGHGMAIESCVYVSSSQWVTGDQDGCVSLWSTAKKKPVYVHRLGPHASKDNKAIGADDMTAPESTTVGAGSVGDACTRWVSAVASCRGTDLVASGSGEGVVRIFQAQGDGGGSEGAMTSLKLLGGYPIRGFVNGLRIAKSGRFFVAGVGQEPRLGRWSRDGKARCGVAIQKIDSDSL